MKRILLAPSRYVQGAGAIKETGVHAARLGDSALIIGGNIALTLEENGVTCHQELFRGVSSRQEVNRLARIATQLGSG